MSTTVHDSSVVLRSRKRRHHSDQCLLKAIEFSHIKNISVKTYPSNRAAVAAKFLSYSNASTMTTRSLLLENRILLICNAAPVHPFPAAPRNGFGCHRIGQWPPY